MVTLSSSLLSLRATVLGVALSIIVSGSGAVSAITGLSQCVQQYEVPQIRYPPPPMFPSSSSSSSSSSQPSTSDTDTNTSNDNSSPRLSVDIGPKQTDQETSWQPPKYELLWSLWHVCYSTRPTYLTLLNMQATHYPILPQPPEWPKGSAMDVVSWSTSDDPDSDAVTTVFGYFKPVAKTPSSSSSSSNTTASNNTTSNQTIQYWPATWRFTSTGILSNTTNLWTILSYGTDTNGIPYRIDYETGYYTAGTSSTNARPCININSRSVDGPSNATLTEIIAGLKQVGRDNDDQDFVDLVDELGTMKTDDRRQDDDEVVCDEDCVENRDLRPVRKRWLMQEDGIIDDHDIFV